MANNPCPPNRPTLTLDPEAFAPLIERVVSETLARVDLLRTPLGDRLAFSEAEAAGLLGIEPHSLREARRRGKIAASRIVGRRIVYSREDLLRYLADNRSEFPKSDAG